MRKILVILTVVFLLSAMLTGCTATPTDAPEKLNVCAIAGPTGVGLVDLMAKNDAGTATGKYAFTVVGDPSQAVAAITSGGADIAAVPTNLAATLHKKTNGNVQVLAVNTLGVLYILERDGNTVNAVADLKGKTVYTSGQGANPEYILRYLLEKNGLDPDRDVDIRFVDDNDTLGTLIANGTAKIAMVPQPKAEACVLTDASVRVALDMNGEWDKIAEGGARLAMGCVIARRDFLTASEANRAAVEEFLREYEASIAAVQSDVATAAEQCVTYGIIPKAPLAVRAIPLCHLTFVRGEELKTQLGGYLQVLYDHNPASVGGELPGEDFYYVG